MNDVLTAEQRRVAEKVIAEEASRRHHLVVSLSGAHAYGFPSPDSDLDLKAVHAEPTSSLLSLQRRVAAAERLEVVDGVEVDYSSNEIHPVLAGVLQGNGNYLERFLGAIPLAASPELDSLRPLVRAALSRRIHRHYSGFARSQLMAWREGGLRSAKKFLYVLRTALTGVHALLEREVVTDVTALLDRYGFGAALELVERKRTGERVDLSEDVARRWDAQVARAFELLDGARDRSPLPEEASGAEELDAWLRELRRSRW